MKILIALVVAVVLIIVYALCKISSECSREEERMIELLRDMEENKIVPYCSDCGKRIDDEQRT